MKKLPSLTLALILAAIATGGRVVITRVAAQENDCQATIQAIRSDITNRLGGSIYQLQESQIQLQPLSPYNQKGEILFSLGGYEDSRRGQRSRDIMMSESLLADYSGRIIKSCADIVRVTFGMMSSDWVRSYSWIDNKYVRKDECLEPRRDIDRNLVWGQQFCT
jgi:hypothetical protein